MNENEIELSELSKDTIRNYIHTSFTNQHTKSFRRGMNTARDIDAGTYKPSDDPKLHQRIKGMYRATKKLANESEFNLDDYSVDEIQEFISSSDFESLDELSKKTLGNYIKKAAGNAVQLSRKEHNLETQRDNVSSAMHNAPSNIRSHLSKAEQELNKQRWDANDKQFKRSFGIAGAVKRLTKESGEVSSFVDAIVEQRAVEIETEFDSLMRSKIDGLKEARAEEIVKTFVNQSE